MKNVLGKNIDFGRWLNSPHSFVVIKFDMDNVCLIWKVCFFKKFS